MFKIRKYFKPYIWALLSVVGLLFIQAMADLALPDYMSKIVNFGIVESDISYIIRIGGLMLLISLLSAVCTIIVGFLASKVAAGVSQTLRSDLFSKVENFSNAEFDKFSTASLITRNTNDVQQIQMFLAMFIRIVVYAPIIGVGAIIRALSKSTSMSWIVALAVIVLLSTLLSVFAIAAPKFKKIQSLIDKLNLVTREQLTGMLVIRAFGTQKQEEKRFDVANKDLTKVSLFINRIFTILMPFMMLLMNGVSLVVILVGANFVNKGTLQVGDMIAFIQYTVMILMSFIFVTMVFILFPRASVSAIRIDEVLRTIPTINDPKNPVNVENLKGLIEFNDVCFKYDGAENNVLEDISFISKPGQTTAIIGSTGSGKTTLINLIPRFYDVTQGNITIDGIDIKDMTQHDLRSHIGFIPQKAVLFSGTIASNLRYADENATDEDLELASNISQSQEFIEQKEGKFESEVAGGGTNVSGGQRQRLSIARALIKKPPIYIFDDSFSALDFKTDLALRTALKMQTGESTVIIVGQRINTIMHADQIIVLDDGKIAGKGTHRDLLQTCSVYKEIALSQLSEEELA
jgi:ATP-binding cassette, subfamily B, multidrug efflux pump